MLKCFGKCSSDTYVVNKQPRIQRQHKNVINGGSKLAPLPSEPVSEPEKTLKEEVKQNAPTPLEVTIEQNEGLKNDQNSVLVEVPPAITQPSNQPSQSLVVEEKKEVKRNAPTPPEITIEQNEEIKNYQNSVLVEVTPELTQPFNQPSQSSVVEKKKEPNKLQENSVVLRNDINNGPVDVTPISKEFRIEPSKQSSQLLDVEDKKVDNKLASQETVPIESIYEETSNFKNDDLSVTSILKTETKFQNTESNSTNNTKTTTNNSKIKEVNGIQEPNGIKEGAVEKVNNVPKRKKNEKIVHSVSESEASKDDSGDDEESELYIEMRKPDSTLETSMIKKNKNEGTKKVRIDEVENGLKPSKIKKPSDAEEIDTKPVRRRSGITPLPVKYDEATNAALPNYPKDPDDEVLIKKAIESNDFLSKIIFGQRLDDVIRCMYNKEISAKESIIKQGEKGSHMYVSAKGNYQVLVKGKVVGTFNDVRVFGELAILYNAKRLATVKAITSGRVWVLDRNVYQQIMVGYNIKEQDETMEFLMNNKKLNVVGKEALQEVANLLKSEFFSAGKQIVRQGDKGVKFYIIRAGTVTITKDGEGVVGNYKKGDCFGELALLKEDCRQATVTADAPGVECLTLTRKEFIDHFGELGDLTEIKPRPQDSIKAIVAEHDDINLTDLKIIKTLGVGGFGRVELVQHTKKKDLVFALKYLKKIDIVLQHQQEHVYNEKNIQMASKSPFIVRLYRTYKDSKYIYLLMESCLGGDLWSLLQKQRARRFDEKEARFISGCVLEAFEYLHSRGIIYRDLKPENLLIASNGYIKLTDFGFAKKISSRGRTFTFAGTPEYVAPEIVLNKGHDRAVDYWAFGAFIFEMLTGRTPFRTDDSSHMKTYNKILNGIDNIQFPSYVNLKARHIIEKLCRPVPSERLGMQRGGIKDIKTHKWFLGFDWQKFAKCEIPSPFRPKLKSSIDTQHFDAFKKDTDIPPDELSGWDGQF